MLYLVSPVLATVIVAAIIGFGGYRRKHNDQTFRRVGWAVAHHVVAFALAAGSIVILELPPTMFPPNDDGGFLEDQSWIALSAAFATMLLIPLTIIAGAVITFARNPWFQDIVVGLVWVLTAWLLWEFAASWASTVASS